MTETVETITEPGSEKLFELLEAVRYAEAHDATVVVIRDGKVEIERRASTPE